VKDPVFLHHLVIYLGAAVLCVPLAKRWGLGSVLGYLLAGLLIGPSGLRLIGEGEEVLHFAEFGVVIMLFLVGMELAPRRLWEMRRPILGLGGLQVLATTLLLAGFGMALGMGGPVALIAAMGMSLSSTAIALQILAERNQLATPGGRAGFATLLFQDLAVIPMLALIPLLGDHGSAGPFDWLGAARAAAVIAGIVLGGHLLLRPLLRFVASTGMREIFTAFALLIVIAIALLMRSAGMSMALGTFLAGVLLAESEYRHALESDLEPFKGLLLGLFFIAIGMSVNLALILSHWKILAALMAGFVLAKMLILGGLARWFGIPRAQQPFFAITLSQGGEFAFVLNSTAESQGILPAEIAGVLVAVVALSMMTTPLLLILHDRWIEPRLGRNKPAYDTPEAEGNPVIIAGFGRFGQIVGRLLGAHRIGLTILDHDPVHIETIRRYGHKVFYGDATRLDLLRAAGADQAKFIIVAIDDMEHSLKLVDMVQQEFSHLTILARARNVQHVFELTARGVPVIQREIFESALVLGERALVEMGYRPYAARQAALKFRSHDLRSLVKRYEARGNEEELVTVAREARQQLEKAMDADREAYNPGTAPDAWR
jgi:glutathione-regulated potassium-efflux system ancillary protein KefC